MALTGARFYYRPARQRESREEYLKDLKNRRLLKRRDGYIESPNVAFSDERIRQQRQDSEDRRRIKNALDYLAGHTSEKNPQDEERLRAAIRVLRTTDSRAAEELEQIARHHDVAMLNDFAARLEATGRSSEADRYRQKAIDTMRRKFEQKKPAAAFERLGGTPAELNEARIHDSNRGSLFVRPYDRETLDMEDIEGFLEYNAEEERQSAAREKYERRLLEAKKAIREEELPPDGIDHARFVTPPQTPVPEEDEDLKYPLEAVPDAEPEAPDDEKKDTAAEEEVPEEDGDAPAEPEVLAEDEIPAAEDETPAVPFVPGDPEIDGEPVSDAIPADTDAAEAPAATPRELIPDPPIESPAVVPIDEKTLPSVADAPVEEKKLPTASEAPVEEKKAPAEEKKQATEERPYPAIAAHELPFPLNVDQKVTDAVDKDEKKLVDAYNAQRRSYAGITDRRTKSAKRNLALLALAGDALKRHRSQKNRDRGKGKEIKEPDIPIRLGFDDGKYTLFYNGKKRTLTKIKGRNATKDDAHTAMNILMSRM